MLGGTGMRACVAGRDFHSFSASAACFFVGYAG